MATPDAASWLPTPSSTYEKDDMITLLVGEEEHRMLAHGSFISLHSDFFKAALRKEWIEGQTRTVKLPEENNKTMAYYFDFISGKGLPTDFTKDDSREGAVHNVLTELFALGERLMDSTIRSATLKEIVRFTTVKSPNGRGPWFPDNQAVTNI